MDVEAPVDAGDGLEVVVEVGLELRVRRSVYGRGLTVACGAAEGVVE